jgi:hypothetical protein
MLLSGELSVEDLDDEELARGYPRSINGTFQGNRPKVIPKVIHDKMIRELFSRADTLLRENLVQAVDTMARIMNDPTVDTAQRLKAAQWIYERTRGKVPDVIHVSAELQPYEELLDELHRGAGAAGGPPESMIVEGEIIDDRY